MASPYKGLFQSEILALSFVLSFLQSVYPVNFQVFMILFVFDPLILLISTANVEPTIIACTDHKWIPNVLQDSRLKPLQPILYNVTRLIFLKWNVDLPPILHTFRIFYSFPSGTEYNPISTQWLLGPDDLMTWPSTASLMATFPLPSGPSTLPKGYVLPSFSTSLDTVPFHCAPTVPTFLSF